MRPASTFSIIQLSNSRFLLFFCKFLWFVLFICMCYIIFIITENQKGDVYAKSGKIP